MDDEQLRRLIASLSLLSTAGPVPTDTFSVLASAVPSEKLAEQLHQRWLCDPSFARIAAHILLHLHNMDGTDVALTSFCLAHLLSDYRARDTIRLDSRLMFRNSVRALLELYPVYRQVDEIVSECLVVPLFVSLEALVDIDADEKDMQAVADMLLDHGGTLSKARPSECEKIIMDVRRALCDAELTSPTRRRLLHVIDLWTYGWQVDAFPDSLLNFHAYQKAADVKLFQSTEVKRALRPSVDSFVKPAVDKESIV